MIRLWILVEIFFVAKISASPKITGTCFIVLISIDCTPIVVLFTFRAAEIVTLSSVLTPATPANADLIIESWARFAITDGLSTLVLFTPSEVYTGCPLVMNTRLSLSIPKKKSVVEKAVSRMLLNDRLFTEKLKSIVSNCFTS